MSALPPAGWYPDPEVPTGHRYWDGTQWTSHRAPPTPPPAPRRPGRVPVTVWGLAVFVAVVLVALAGKGIAGLADADLASGTARATAPATSTAAAAPQAAVPARTTTSASPAPASPSSRATAPRPLVPTVPKPVPTPVPKPAPKPSPRPSPKPSPAACLIKGNIASDGERIYHVPGGQFYDVTKISPAKGERWFCSEADAVAAGWRKSKR